MVYPRNFEHGKNPVTYVAKVRAYLLKYGVEITAIDDSDLVG